MYDYNYTSSCAAIIEAFTIFKKYEEANNLQGYHAQIVAGPDPRKVSISDHRKLRHLGWRIAPEEYFYKYT
jgi:hypothetical protein